jgi:putative transposase
MPPDGHRAIELLCRSRAGPDDTALVEAMHAVKDEFEAYGWRRVQAALRQEGWVVNHEKIKRLMREHGLKPVLRRRFVATTDSDHDQPIFPDRTRDLGPVSGPNQLWVADLTYVAVAAGFVYVALIMDAWSRRIVGYAIGRRIDGRLTLAALDAAIGARHPPPGCIYHSDRGSQYAALSYRDRLAAAGLAGSMGRRGNPYDNAMAESLMKTLKVRASTRWTSRPSRMSRRSSTHRSAFDPVPIQRVPERPIQFPVFSAQGNRWYNVDKHGY